MAQHTPTQPGSLLDSATFGGSLPASPYSLIIADDDVEVPAGQTYTIGEYPEASGSTPAIEWASSASTGRLIFRAGSTLVFKGDIRQGNGEIITEEGVTFIHDSSDTTAKPGYVIEALASNLPNCKIIGVGTEESPCEFRNADGSGRFANINGSQTGLDGTYNPTSLGFTGTGRCEFDWWTFTGLGNGDVEWFCTNLNLAGAEYIFRNCRSYDCTHRHIIRNFHSEAVWVEDDCYWLDPHNGRNLLYWNNSSIAGAGIRQWTNVVHDGSVEAYYSKDITMDNVSAAGSSSHVPINGNSTDFVVSEASDVFFLNRVGGNTPMNLLRGGDVNRVTSLKIDDVDADHMAAAGSSDDVNYYGVLTQTSDPTGGGEILKNGAKPASPCTFKFRNHLSLRSQEDPDKGSGAMVALVAGGPTDEVSTIFWDIENFTLIGGDSDALLIEQVKTVSGLVPNLSKGIVYCENGEAARVVDEVTVDIVDDTFTNVRTNNVYGSSAPDPYTPDEAAFANGSGVGDTTYNPLFVNAGFTFLEWANTLGTFTDWEDVWETMKLPPEDPGYIEGLNAKAFYVAAFLALTPQEDALRTSGYDGGYVGAAEIFILDVEADFDLQWSALSAVEHDTDLQWSALAAVESDADLQWSALSVVESDCDLQWSLLGLVESDSDMRWSALEAVESDADIQWSLLEPVESDSDLQWSLLGAVESDADIRWSVSSAEVAGSVLNGGSITITDTTKYFSISYK